MQFIPRCCSLACTRANHHKSSSVEIDTSAGNTRGSCARLSLFLSLSLSLSPRLNIAGQKRVIRRANRSARSRKGMADNFTSLRNDRTRIFHLVAQLSLLRSRKHSVKGAAPTLRSRQRGLPIEIQWTEEASRRSHEERHSKHSAGVIPFVLDSRFLNKVSRPLPRGPPPLSSKARPLLVR